LRAQKATGIADLKTNFTNKRTKYGFTSKFNALVQWLTSLATFERSKEFIVIFSFSTFPQMVTKGSSKRLYPKRS